MRRSHGRPLTALCAVALFTATVAPPSALLTSTAFAQANPAKARAVYGKAKRAFQQKSYAEAAALFKEAYEYDPKPQLLFNIGQALKEAGELAEAESYYKRYLEELPEAPNRDEVLATLFTLQQVMAASMAMITIDTEEGLQVFVDQEPEPRCETPCIINVNPGPHVVAVVGERYEREEQSVAPEAQEELMLSFTPKLKPGFMGSLTVTTDVEGAVLMVDGRPAGKLPLLDPIPLEPGVYPVAVMVAGATKWTGTATVKADEVATLNVPLKDSLNDEDDGGGGGTMRVVAFSLWGAGAVSLGAGALFGLSASSVESDLDAQLGRGEQPNSELIDQGESQALMANVFYLVGVAAIGTGVALYLLDGGDSEQGEPTAQGPATDVVPLEGGALLRIQTPF